MTAPKGMATSAVGMIVRGDEPGLLDELTQLERRRKSPGPRRGEGEELAWRFRRASSPGKPLDMDISVANDTALCSNELGGGVTAVLLAPVLRSVLTAAAGCR